MVFTPNILIHLLHTTMNYRCRFMAQCTINCIGINPKYSTFIYNDIVGICIFEWILWSCFVFRDLKFKKEKKISSAVTNDIKKSNLLKTRIYTPDPQFQKIRLIFQTNMNWKEKNLQCLKWYEWHFDTMTITA